VDFIILLGTSVNKRPRMRRPGTWNSCLGGTDTRGRGAGIGGRADTTRHNDLRPPHSFVLFVEMQNDFAMYRGRGGFRRCTGDEEVGDNVQSKLEKLDVARIHPNGNHPVRGQWR